MKHLIILYIRKDSQSQLTIWAIYILHRKINFWYVEDRQLLGTSIPRPTVCGVQKIP